MRRVAEAFRVGLGQQRLVVELRGHRREEGEHDHLLELVQRRHLLVERQQHVVHDQEAAPASPAIQPISSGDSRRFSVCITPPAAGMPK